jgi:small multidrug resistance family-3 protein
MKLVVLHHRLVARVRSILVVATSSWVGAGAIAFGLYGLVATGQRSSEFGRILVAYSGVFLAGFLAWGALIDRFKPDRDDYIGAARCLAGVAVIMCAPRA